MSYYVGMDVSLEESHLCVLDDGGGIVARGSAASEPVALGAWLSVHAPVAAVVVLETGGFSSWLSSGLQELGVPAVIVDARLPSRRTTVKLELKVRKRGLPRLSSSRARS